MTRRHSPSAPGAIDYLFSLEHFGIKFGLENIAAILDALGHPERAFRSVHIAGTNGKGSVAAMVDMALRAAGHRAGRYTSPHLVRLNERFTIDGRPIGDDELVAVIDEVRSTIDALRADGRLDVQPTFFEVTTVVAFELFRRARVEVAAIEVGLGGRLDATNVLTPMATAITSIGLDHQQYLGNTLRQIALEKAGIIKPGVPVVVGEMPREALDAIAQVARDRGSDLIRAGGELPPAYRDVRLALRGAHQIRNAAVAVALLERMAARGIAVSPADIAAGLTRVSWPGRLDLRRFADGRELLLDAAHNQDGAAALAAFLETWTQASGAAPPPTTKVALVCAVMRDKNLAETLRPLLPYVETLVATRASNPRSVEPSALADVARAIAPTVSIVIESSPLAALDIAWQHATRVVVAGSIFLLGDVLAELDVGS